MQYTTHHSTSQHVTIQHATITNVIKYNETKKKIATYHNTTTNATRALTTNTYTVDAE